MQYPPPQKISMLTLLFKELRAAGIKYVVAPYEADSQMAYFCRKGLAAAAVTEDSDLLVFRCNEVLYKLDTDSTFTRIRYKDIFKIPGMENISPERFTEMCILTGCDYLPSPKRVGIKTAYSMLKNNSAAQLFKLWDRYPNDSKTPERSPDYENRFRVVTFVFNHQYVYDDDKQMLVNLMPIDEGVELDDEIRAAIGPYIDPETAKGIARGFLNPATHEPYMNKVIIPAQLTISANVQKSRGEIIDKPSKKQDLAIKAALNIGYPLSSLQEPSLPEAGVCLSESTKVQNPTGLHLSERTTYPYFTKITCTKRNKVVPTTSMEVSKYFLSTSEITLRSSKSKNKDEVCLETGNKTHHSLESSPVASCPQLSQPLESSDCTYISSTDTTSSTKIVPENYRGKETPAFRNVLSIRALSKANSIQSSPPISSSGIKQSLKISCSKSAMKQFVQPRKRAAIPNGSEIEVASDSLDKKVLESFAVSRRSSIRRPWEREGILLWEYLFMLL